MMRPGRAPVCARQLLPAAVMLCHALPLVLLPAAPGRAAEWEVSSGVTANAQFTDNFCLIQNGDDAEVIGTVTPRVNLSGRGARASVALRGGVEFNTIDQIDTECPRVGAGGGQRSNRESVIPNIGFLGDLELLRDTLILTANAEARQNAIDPFRAGGNNALNGRDNTNITYRYGAGAIFQRRIASAAELRATYNYSEQYNAVNVLGDSIQHRADVLFGTLPERARLSVALFGNVSRVEFEENDQGPAFDNELSRAELRTGLQLSDSLQLTALAGQEWNDFLIASDGDIDGTYWDAGFVWSPNSRLQLSAGTGERFFGDTPRVSLNWRHKRSALRLSWQRTITFPFNLRARGRPQPSQDPVLDEVFDEDFGILPGDPIGVEDTPTFVGRSPILIESMQFSYSFRARRTSFSVIGSESQQTRAADLGEGTFRNAGITAVRTLSPQMSLNLGLRWQESEGTGGNVGSFGRNAETWTGNAGLSRRVGNNTTLNLNYQYTDRQSDFALNTFEENRIILSVSHQFR